MLRALREINLWAVKRTIVFAFLLFLSYFTVVHTAMLRDLDAKLEAAEKRIVEEVRATEEALQHIRANSANHVPGACVDDVLKMCTVVDEGEF